MSFEGPTRFKSDATANYGQFRDAAVDYIANLAEGDLRGLLEKPLDWRPGNVSYFLNMQQLLAGVQALDLPPAARILEVGSGAGWTTEVLASLAFRVHCVEPSAEMIEVAQQRLMAHLARHGAERLYKNVRWQQATIEDCKLPKERFDAVIYFESFHHVIDEKKAVGRTLRFLKPGGKLLILGDSNWIPGYAEQEDAWDEEMRAYGTLESPFTDAYLVWLLGDMGFVDVERFHLVRGLIPVSQDAEPARSFALLDANWVNLVIARKPTQEEIDNPPSVAEPETPDEPAEEPVMEVAAPEANEPAPEEPPADQVAAPPPPDPHLPPRPPPVQATGRPGLRRWAVTRLLRWAEAIGRP